MSKSTGKCLSRRKLIGSGIAAGAGIALGLPGVLPAAQQQSPAAADELVLVNGRIHTMDGNNSIVQTVSMRNGRFVTVGGAAPRRGPGIRIIDLKGHTVVPGIIDNHNHIVLMGNRDRAITHLSRMCFRFVTYRRRYRRELKDSRKERGSQR